MAEIGSAFLTIAPSAKGFGSSLNSQVSGETRSAGRSIGRTFGKMFVLGASVIAAAGVGRLLKGSIEEAREANKVGATTEQVIKATGGAAKITAKQVGDMATRLSLVTGVDDETIQQGENLLLTFKNVKNYVDGEFVGTFDRATQAGLDLAATGFGSIEGNAKMLGKALNDPTKGITALTRAGVTFTDQQKEQIKGFVESGDAAKAQNLILTEVEHQVGGVAAATATSTDKAKVAWGNLKEDLGQKLIPIVDKLADVFVSLAPKIGPAFSKVGDLIGRLRDYLAPFVAQVLGFFRGEGGAAIKDFAARVGDSFRSDVLPVLQQVGDFIAANFVPAVRAIADIFKKNVLPVLQSASDTFLNVVLPAITSLAEYLAAKLFPIFKQVAIIVATQVIPIIGSLAKFFYTTLYPAIVDIVVAVGKSLKPVFDQLAATFKTSVLPTVSKLLDKFEEWRPTIQKVIVIVLKIVGVIAKFVALILAKVLPVLIRLAGYLLEKIVPAIASVIDYNVDLIKKLIEVAGQVKDFAAKVKDRFDKVAKWVENAVHDAKDAIGRWMGRALAPIQALINKIQDAINKFNELRGKAAGGVKGQQYTPGGGGGGGGGKEPTDRVLARAGLAGGKVFGQGFADGIAAKGKEVDEKTKKLLDRLKAQFADVKGEFTSLKDSVASAFTGSLFEAENRGDFLSSLLGTRNQLSGLKAAFTKLLGWGLKPEFLSQLFQSGNGGLILDLAAGSKAEATQADALFGQVQTLSSQLGASVADVKFGDKLDGIREEIRELRKDQKGNHREVGVAVGREINSAVRAGYRRGRAA